MTIDPLFYTMPAGTLTTTTGGCVPTTQTAPFPGVTFIPCGPPVPNVCHGCGRCRSCGQPYAAPHPDTVPPMGPVYPCAPTYPAYPWPPGIQNPIWHVGDPIVGSGYTTISGTAAAGSVWS
jgi:hypothetical protein